MNQTNCEVELTGSGQLTYDVRHVEGESFRAVPVHLLLLCMRVPWRGEVADLSKFF